MPSHAQKIATFRALHSAGCFVMANVWEVGAARLFAGMGFQALATSSAALAVADFGTRDGSDAVTRAVAIDHAAKIAGATDLPVSADLEDLYAPSIDDIPETIRMAHAAGLSGISIEDTQARAALPFEAAQARVKAAIAANAALPNPMVLTARADGLLYDSYDLDSAIRRLQAFGDAGADVVYAPGLDDLAALTKLCQSVGKPVNHVIGLGARGLTQDQIAGAGVRRISLGGSLMVALYTQMFATGRAILDEGRFDTLGRENLRETFRAISDGAPKP